MLDTIKVKKPAFCVLENVTGLMGFREDVSKTMRVKLEEQYVVYHMKLDPRDQGHCVRRPRVYFIVLRKDVLLCDPAKLASLAQHILQSVKQDGQSVKVQQFMLADTHPLVVESQLQQDAKVKRKPKPIPKDKGFEAKWYNRHAALWASLGRRCSDCPVPGSRLKNMGSRREDALKIAWQQHRRLDMVVDLSQNAGRMPVAFQGECPTLTPGGHVFVLSAQRALLPEEKLLINGFPASSFMGKCQAELRPRELSSLAGNTMHVEVVAAVSLIALSLIDLRALGKSGPIYTGAQGSWIFMDLDGSEMQKLQSAKKPSPQRCSLSPAPTCRVNRKSICSVNMKRSSLARKMQANKSDLRVKKTAAKPKQTRRTSASEGASSFGGPNSKPKRQMTARVSGGYLPPNGLQSIYNKVLL
ncbi:ngoBIM [Symbiodinium sp. CCMP2592]|nr:ngoBIM [Symbiodinium sp. CCMP2592]